MQQQPPFLRFVSHPSSLLFASTVAIVNRSGPKKKHFEVSVEDDPQQRRRMLGMLAYLPWSRGVMLASLTEGLDPATIPEWHIEANNCESLSFLS
jgi:hypothetical protein